MFDRVDSVWSTLTNQLTNKLASISPASGRDLMGSAAQGAQSIVSDAGRSVGCMTRGMISSLAAGTNYVQAGAKHASKALICPRRSTGITALVEQLQVRSLDLTYRVVDRIFPYDPVAVVRPSVLKFLQANLCAAEAPGYPSEELQVLLTDNRAWVKTVSWLILITGVVMALWAVSRRESLRYVGRCLYNSLSERISSRYGKHSFSAACFIVKALFNLAAAASFVAVLANVLADTPSRGLVLAFYMTLTREGIKLWIYLQCFKFLRALLARLLKFLRALLARLLRFLRGLLAMLTRLLKLCRSCASYLLIKSVSFQNAALASLRAMCRLQDLFLLAIWLSITAGRVIVGAAAISLIWLLPVLTGSVIALCSALDLLRLMFTRWSMDMVACATIEQLALDLWQSNNGADNVPPLLEEAAALPTSVEGSEPALTDAPAPEDPEVAALPASLEGYKPVLTDAPAPEDPEVAALPGSVKGSEPHSTNATCLPVAAATPSANEKESKEPIPDTLELELSTASPTLSCQGSSDAPPSLESPSTSESSSLLSATAESSVSSTAESARPVLQEDEQIKLLDAANELALYNQAQVAYDNALCVFESSFKDKKAVYGSTQNSRMRRHECFVDLRPIQAQFDIYSRIRDEAKSNMEKMLTGSCTDHWKKRLCDLAENDIINYENKHHYLLKRCDALSCQVRRHLDEFLGDLPFYHRKWYEKKINFDMRWIVPPNECASLRLPYSPDTDKVVQALRA